MENEAVITMLWGGYESSEPKTIKRLILDKPFWVMMKRTDSENPYFILGVNNTQIME